MSGSHSYARHLSAGKKGDLDRAAWGARRDRWTERAYSGARPGRQRGGVQLVGSAMGTRWAPMNKAANPFAPSGSEEHRLGAALGNLPDERTTALDLGPLTLPPGGRRAVAPKPASSYPPGGNAKAAEGRGARLPGGRKDGRGASPPPVRVKALKGRESRRQSFTNGAPPASYRRHGRPAGEGVRRMSEDVRLRPRETVAGHGAQPSPLQQQSPTAVVPDIPLTGSTLNQNAKLPPPPAQAALRQELAASPAPPGPPGSHAPAASEASLGQPTPHAAPDQRKGPPEQPQPQQPQQQQGGDGAGGAEGWEAVNKLVPGLEQAQWGGTMKSFAVDEELKHFLKCCKETGFLNLTHNSWAQLPKQAHPLPPLNNLSSPTNTHFEVEYFIADFGHSLRTLNLESSCLEVCPDLHSMPNLVSLNLARNKIKSVPASIAALSALTSLSLDRNGLPALPDVIGSRTTLTYLDVSHNELQWLPESFARLVQLRTLNINNNMFSHVPSSVAQMADLVELNASHNKVTGIPATISGLHKLAILRLDHNLLASLPQALGGLWRSLQELDLGENDLSQLPSSLGACRKLETLVLNLNPLQFPPLSVVEQGVEAAHKEAMGEKSRVGEAVNGMEDQLAQMVREQIGDFCIDCSQMAFSMAMTSEEVKIQLKAQNRQLRQLLEEKEFELDMSQRENQLLRNKIVDTNKMMRAAEKALRDAMQGQTQLLEKTVLQETEIQLLERKLATVTARYDAIQADLNESVAALNAAREAEGDDARDEAEPIKVAEIVKANAELSAALTESREQAAAYLKLAQERKDAWIWSAANWQARIKEREEELAAASATADAREKQLLREADKARAKVAELEAMLGRQAKYMEWQPAAAGKQGKQAGQGGPVAGGDGGEDEEEAEAAEEAARREGHRGRSGRHRSSRSVRTSKSHSRRGRSSRMVRCEEDEGGED
eukprot:jgi/Tetstr1/466309/TSEL_010842.t2